MLVNFSRTALVLVICLVMAPRQPVAMQPGLRGTDLDAQGTQQRARAAIADMAWLSGNWSGRQGDATVEELWSPPSGGAMLAVARTVAGSRMTAFEFLRIVERDGGLVYIAQPNGRPPVEFVLTEIGPRLAVFENPDHDFPQKIRYALQADGTLEAQVSAPGQKPLTFRFERTRPR